MTDHQIETTDTPPVAKIIAVTDIDDIWIVKVRCPHCRRIHTHGGGATDTDPNPGYLLAWTEATT